MATVGDIIHSILEGPPAPLKANDGTPSAKAQLVADLHCELGECVIYNDITHEILFTDIDGCKFYKVSLADGEIHTYELPKMLGAFGMRPAEEEGYICGWEDGFQLFDLEKGKALGEMSEGEPVAPSKLPTRLNDGRCDREGRRFICGGHFGRAEGEKMKVFRCELEGNKLVHAPIQDDLETTNSICFSIDGDTMFLADSPTLQINKFKYDKSTGTLSDKTFLHKRDGAIGFPDGSCVDAEGFVWSTCWREGSGPGMVDRINPQTGEVVYTVHMPDTTSQVTCCCFGGKDLDVLFITSAAVGMDVSAEPHAGALYGLKLPFKGLKESRFVGK